MQLNSFYTRAELNSLGIKKIGDNVYISKFARIYNPECVSIGSNVRIDDFCILTGKIDIGSYIHISAYCGLYGKAGIKLSDYSGISPRCLLFSAIDDFSGEFLIGPMVKSINTNLIEGKIVLEKYVQIGANSIVFPNVTLHEGCATGAFTLINKDLKKWQIFTGIPAKKLRERKKELLNKV